MAVNDELGKRMKENYEKISNFKLVRRMPVIVRIDGKAFHTFTKGFKKPFDYVLMESMKETTKKLCENIQGCVLGYTQSDEISLLLIDYQNLNSCAWFDNEVQKICSISASMATLMFNQIFRNHAESRINNILDDPYCSDYEKGYYVTLRNALLKGAMFDSRVFNIPKEEVTNYFYWRQLDAIRNSIEAVGQFNFSHKELQKKSCGMIKEMLLEQKGIDWDEISVPKKRGTCVKKESYILDDGTSRSRWFIDDNIPIFKDTGRSYIDELIG